MKALFLVNERSGRKRKRDLRAIISEACQWPSLRIENCSTLEGLDATIASAREEGFDAVIAVGGDGTVHEIGCRLLGTGIALGIIPTGSGNGMARHLGIPLSPARAVRALRHAHRLAIDTATVNGRAFIGVMGVGLDALIAHRFAEHHARGLMSYLRAGARSIGGFAGEEYELEIDAECRVAKAMVICVANSSQYGNGARIAPDASMCDGELDLVIVPRPRLPAFPIRLAQLFSGGLPRADGVISRRARRIVIRRAEAGHAHLDGEPLHLEAELTITIRPNSLHVLALRETI